jgi:hypothetical protein
MSTSTSTSTSVTHEGCADDDVEDDVDEHAWDAEFVDDRGVARGTAAFRRVVVVSRRRVRFGRRFGRRRGRRGMDARIGSAVMDIVPRRDGGETRRRIEMEHEEVMRRHFNADDADAERLSSRLGETRPKPKSKMASKTTSKTIQELVRDARETTQRTWTHVRVTTSRGARVVGRGARSDGVARIGARRRKRTSGSIRRSRGASTNRHRHGATRREGRGQRSIRD